MGTRGYRIIRYRGRYYCFYNHWGSGPETFGKYIVNQIPIDPQIYRAWLAAERAKVAKWDEAVTASLRIERADTDTREDENCSQGSETSSSELSPWQEHIPDVSQFPSYLPEFNDVMIEWVYVVDLDREIFTVDHAVHFRLDKIPRHNWIYALGIDDCRTRILLPVFVPEDSITDLVLRLDPPAAEKLRMYKDLAANVIKARGTTDFPSPLRHGPVLYARVFQGYKRQQKSVLSHLLLGWEPSELHFREMVYAILCLASAGSSTVELVDSRDIGRGGEGYAFLSKCVDGKATTEFLAHLGVGSHLEGNAPGSAPEGLVYWFQGALVLIAAQLNRPGALEESVAQVAFYCRVNCPEDSVNAIVISIEHVVLVRVYADGRVDHTTMLSLFALKSHYSKDTRERYDALAIEEREREAKLSLDDNLSEEDREQMMIHPKSIDNHANDADCRGFGRDMIATEPTFMALVSLLDATARQQLPRSRASEGYFPTEIYRFVIANVVDFETYCACKKVSRNFRDLCQEFLRVGNNTVTILPNRDSRSYMYASDPFGDYHDMGRRIRARVTNGELQSQHPVFRVVQDSTGLSQDLPLVAGTRERKRSAEDEVTWRIVVGSEPDRRSMIPGLGVTFTPAPRS